MDLPGANPGGGFGGLGPPPPVTKGAPKKERKGKEKERERKEKRKRSSNTSRGSRELRKLQGRQIDGGRVQCTLIFKWSWVHIISM